MKLHGEELAVTTVGDLVRSRASEGDKEFVRIQDVILTYGDAHLRSTRFANALAGLGVRKGDIVGTLLHNSVNAVLIWFACAKLGAVWNPVNDSLGSEDLAYTLNDSRATTLITSEELLPIVRAAKANLQYIHQIVVDGPADIASRLGFIPASSLDQGSDAMIGTDVAPSDPMAIIYTGGSTGMPKGVLVPHLYYIAAAMRYRDVCEAQPADVMYECGQLFHSGGQQLGITGPMFCSMTSVMTRRFSVSRFWNIIRANNATIIHVPGTMLGPVLDLPSSELDRAHPARIGVGTGTGMVRRDIRDEFERRFNVRLLEVWAQTEMGVLLCSERLDQRRVGSSGHSDGWAEVRAVDELDQPLPAGEVGELTARPTEPYTFMLGYVNKPDEMLRTWRNLWHHTGDIGYVDKDGYVYFLGRQAHWIRRRSENISAFEVEKLLTSHPDVAGCAIVGVPSTLGDEEIKAYIQVREGASGVTPAGILEWCTGRIAKFKLPRYIEFVTGFPRTTTKGDIERAKLKALGIGSAWDREAPRDASSRS